jgi:ABC-2 type transport system ATP-binding protein
VFLTTHDMDEADYLCDRVVIINHGKLIAIDTPGKLRMAISGMHSVEVSFDGDVDIDYLAALDGVESVRKLGDKYRLYSAHPGDVVVSLVNRVCSDAVKIVSLAILAPSLEDAFVALTEREVKQ